MTTSELLPYFAYGSNMDEAQMRARVPGAKKIGTGSLRGYEFIFSGFSHTWGGAVANVKKQPRAAVFGVLYRLPRGGKARLDHFEGYPTSYRRRRVTVTTIAGPVKAFLYFKQKTRAEAPPNPAYVAQILRSLKRHGAV